MNEKRPQLEITNTDDGKYWHLSDEALKQMLDLRAADARTSKTFENFDRRWSIIQSGVYGVLVLTLVAQLGLIGWRFWQPSDLRAHISRISALEKDLAHVKAKVESLVQIPPSSSAAGPVNISIIERVESIEETLSKAPSEVVANALLSEKIKTFSEDLDELEARVSLDIDRLYSFFMSTLIAAIVAVIAALFVNKWGRKS